MDSALLPAGALLPSEAELAAAYGVSRVTVRRALDLLRDERRVVARQGAGWFVASEPVRQHLDVLATIEGQLAEDGRRSERRVQSFGFVATPPAVAGVLGSDVDEVLEVVRLNLADGRPFALVTVWCPADLGAPLSRSDVESSTFHELLPGRIAGATQTIGAAAATAADAASLEVSPGDPMLVCGRVSRDGAGRPVLVSEHRFPAHRTEFVVELLAPGEDATARSGLRLVQAGDS